MLRTILAILLLSIICPQASAGGPEDLNPEPIVVIFDHGLLVVQLFYYEDHTQNRHYDPSLGRFLQLDPARAGNNHYAYAGGDPVNYWDPNGLWRISADRSFAVSEPGDTIQSLYTELGGPAGTGRTISDFSRQFHSFNGNSALSGMGDGDLLAAGRDFNLENSTGSHSVFTTNDLAEAIKYIDFPIGKILKTTLTKNQAEGLIESGPFVFTNPDALSSDQVNRYGSDIPEYFPESITNRLIAASANQGTARLALASRNSDVQRLTVGIPALFRAVNIPHFIVDTAIGGVTGKDPLLGVDVTKGEALTDLGMMLVFIRGPKVVANVMRKFKFMSETVKLQQLQKLLLEAEQLGAANINRTLYRGINSTGANSLDLIEAVFKSGFLPKGGGGAPQTFNNLITSINKGSRNSGFVQSSTTSSVAQRFATNDGTARGIIFQLSSRKDAVFVNQTHLRKFVDFVGEDIVAFPGGINPNQIIQAAIVDSTGRVIKIIRNPYIK